MATLQEAKKVARVYGAEIHLRRGRRIDVEAWAPAGKAWNATGCHCIHETGEADGAGEVRADVIRLMLEGVTECDDAECDTCHPEGQ